MSNKTSLEFSEKYSEEHARNYRDKHQQTGWRILSNRWEHRMARKALRIAGDPISVLDLPCGTGRFWAMLAQDPARELYAADNSENMVAVADQAHPPEIRDRFTLFRTSAFAVDLEDKQVDNIFCMRLLHHIEAPEHRLQIYREFRRVTRDTVCLSLWVDGNYKAWRRRRLEQRRKTKTKTYQNRLVLPRRQVEEEFRRAGFEILGYVDFIPYFAMWRTYVLKKKT